ncbi:MAG: hypothetical protein P0120_03375 [Nitrospira sp.]|nr:hypothetical protein [Nitrospira sp.]
MYIDACAVSLASGKFVRSMCEKLDALTFEAFLKTLLRHRARGTRMVIVLDNAKDHHAVLLAPLLRKYRRCSRSSSCHHTARNWRPSSESGSWPAGWPRTTVSSNRWASWSGRSKPASIAGTNPMLYCKDYAALFKTLCIERTNILCALDAAKWKVSGEQGAASLLGLNASTLSSRMKTLKIQKPR